MSGNGMLLALVLWPMAGAGIGYGIGRKNKTARDYFADFVGIAEFAAALVLFVLVCTGREYTFFVPEICGRGLSFKLDGFRVLYGLIAAFMWMATTVFSKEYLGHYRNRNRYYLFTLITCGATMGVFLSADLFTTFIFFEIMSFTSYVMVVHEENEGALRAAETYIAVAVIGGMVMLMGLLLLEDRAGTLVIDELYDACKALPDKSGLYLPGILILFGFGAKAGMFPLHIWLPKAHPVAPAPASALLSGILTKAGIFGVLLVTCNIFLHDQIWGMLILSLGVITMFLGAFIALFSIDLKRTLACSSMSQIGFILVGIGMQCLLAEENTLAVWGTTLHMVNHSLIKLVLFMCAGVIFMNLHKLDLNEIRGFGRNKPFLKAAFLAGYLGIIGMPLFNGYVSKTLLHESIVEYIEILTESGAGAGLFHAIEWIFLISGGLTAAYMTKLFVAVFVEKNPKDQKKMDGMRSHYMNWQSRLAIGIPALILPLLGFFPQIFMTDIAQMAEDFMHGAPMEETFAFFSLTNLRGAAISLAIGAVVYFGFIRTLLMKKDENGVKVYVNRWPAFLDLENLIYRPLLEKILPGIGEAFSRFFDRLTDRVKDVLVVLGAALARLFERVTDGIAAFFTGVLLKPIKIPERDPRDYEAGSLLREDHISKWIRNFTGRLSFGLMLFGIGFCATMIYLVVVLLR